MLQVWNVPAGGECTAFPGHNHGANVFVGSDFVKCVEDLFAHRPAESVQLFRPVELDGGYGIRRR